MRQGRIEKIKGPWAGASFGALSKKIINHVLMQITENY